MPEFCVRRITSRYIIHTSQRHACKQIRREIARFVYIFYRAFFFFTEPEKL